MFICGSEIFLCTVARAPHLDYHPARDCRMPILPNLGPMARMVSVALGLAAVLYGILAVEADWLRILCALLAVWLITEGLIGFSTFVRLFRGTDQRR